jgi:CysZ protein
MFRDLTSSMLSYTKAIPFISKHRLWGYFLFPGLVSLLLGIAIFTTAWNASDNIGGWIISFYPFEWGKSVLERVAEVFGGLFVAAIGLILFKHLVLAIASPAMSFLSEKVEKIVNGYSPTIPLTLNRMLGDILRGLRIALRNIIRELFYTLLLFIAGLLIPFISPFTTVAIFAVQSFYAGFGNMDFTLERYYRVRGSVRFVRANRWLALGNGIVFMALLLTGIGFLFALPLGTVAATRETLKRLPEPTGPE